MAITVVQSIAHAGNPPATFSSPVTAGNTVFLVAAGYTTAAGNPATATMKVGGTTITAAVAYFNPGTTNGILSPLSGSNGAYIAIWMAPNIPGGGSTVDITFSGASGIIGQVIYEVSGLGASPVLDQRNSGGAASGTAVSSGATGAITAAPEFVLAGAMAFVGVPATATGFTCLQPGGGADMCAGWQIPVSAGGTYTWTQTSSGSPWASGIVTVYATPVPAPFYPVTRAKARLPVPFLKGRTASSPGGPVTNPGVVPVYGAVPGAVRACLPVNPRGRTSSNAGTPAQNPAAGPAFRQANQALRARTPLPPPRGAYTGPGTGSTSSGTGRTQWAAGAPVRNPAQGPAFYPKNFARARQPLPCRGRTASNPGGPVQNPPSSGPAFSQATAPARIRPSLPPRGRTASCPGTPARNPSAGPAFPAAHGPAQARTPLPPRGRCAGSQGVPPPPPPVPAPVYPWHGPVQARRPLPPRGCVITGSPGAPVRNPHPGPPVYPQQRPAGLANRAPGPYLKGRAAGNPGGPVSNIRFATLKFSTGIPEFQWATGTPQAG